MAPREMIVTMTKQRMGKLNRFGGGPIPILRMEGAGKSGGFIAMMVPKNNGGMLSAVGGAARRGAFRGGAARRES